MIPKFLIFSNKNLGSSLIFFAQGGVGKKKNQKSAEKRAVAEARARRKRGVGEFCLARAEAKPRRPARSEQRSAKKFSFPFRRKNRAGAK